MTYFKRIIGEKCYLSPFCKDEIEKITGWSNDKDVYSTTLYAHKLVSLNQQEELLKDKTNTFSIVDLETNNLLGHTGIFDIDNINRKANFGIIIGNKKFHGKGYGQEATKLILDFAFNILNFNNIFLSVFSYNTKGYNCYKKIGFKEIGRRRKSWFYGGKYYDEIYMDLLVDEFNKKYETIFKP
ncbi:MAG TPA: GNAT family protein [Victivallales bacterium]|nr:GNAT family protein [Victivallales bacterium]